MKYVVYKMYADYEKEERWLNEMSSRGMALVGYSWCRYVFEDTPRGEYIYRLELLGELPSHPESVAYLRFLEETGVEVVDTYMRWVYLRKKAADGAFDLYTDLESRIRHYRIVRTLWLTLGLAELSIGLSNLGLGILELMEHTIPIRIFNLTMGAVLTGVGLLFLLRLALPTEKKIRRLGRDRLLRE